MELEPGLEQQVVDAVRDGFADSGIKYNGETVQELLSPEYDDF